MTILKKAALAAAILMSSNSMAATLFTDAVSVSSVIPSNAGNVIVGATVTTNANPANCANAGFLLSAADAGFKNMYATVLTAMASGGTVTFGLSDTDCSGGGTAGFPIIEGLIVTPPA